MGICFRIAANIAFLFCNMGLAHTKPSSLPPCLGPVFAAASMLLEAKQFDRAHAVLAPMLVKADTVVCAAAMSVQIERTREAVPKPKMIDEAWDRFKESGVNFVFWTAVAAALFVVGAVIVGFFRLLSAAKRKWFRPTWRIYRIAEGADHSIVNAWRIALKNGPTRADANANLLIQSGLPLPKSMVIGVGLMPSEDIFEGAPNFQGISLSWMSRVLSILMRYCHSPRRTLSLAITSHEKSAIVTIEACDANSHIRTATGVAVWTSDADAMQEIEKMATALALKTSYLIADGATDGSVAMQLRLRAGIEKLNAYSEQNDVTALRQAAESFESARSLSQGDLTPILYQGITFELLEDHDRAQRLFEEIVGPAPVTAQATHIQLQASYNLAVSHLRRYKARAVVEATEGFDRVVAGIAAMNQGSLTEEKIAVKAFALAASANARAHYFIFWNTIGVEGPLRLDGWNTVELAKKQVELAAWQRDADTLISEAEKQLKSNNFDSEGVFGIQLSWLINNAKGNLALNRAKCQGPAGVINREEILRQSLEAFRTCEALVKPGVETLTNIATTLLELNQPTAALDYTRRARELNPQYEYAWFREYEIQELRSDHVAKSSLLRKANDILGIINISEFQQKFRDSGVRFHER